MCTACLKRQFKIAEKDGVLECKCPNPYCRKTFDQVSCTYTHIHIHIHIHIYIELFHY